MVARWTSTTSHRSSKGCGFEPRRRCFLLSVSFCSHGRLSQGGGEQTHSLCFFCCLDERVFLHQCLTEEVERALRKWLTFESCATTSHKVWRHTKHIFSPPQSRCANAGTRCVAGKAQACFPIDAFSLKETSLQVSYHPSVSSHRGALSICLPAAEGPIVVLNNVVPLFTVIFVDDQRKCPVSCPLPKRHSRTQRSKIIKMVDEKTGEICATSPACKPVTRNEKLA
jgi:hypothetical protein